MLTFKAIGIRNIYYFMVACCCVSFLLTVFFVRGTSLKREDDARLQEEGKKWAAKHRGIHALGKKKPETTVEVDNVPSQAVMVPDAEVKK